MKKILLLLICISLPVDIIAQQTGYLWPTDASPYLTSTFGETRSAHFHAGLDIKTWGREGYKVFASKSGKIIRMAITSQGYGRVLYMQHEDSTYTVYAHLQRFIPELQSHIDSVRLLNNQFEIDLDTKSSDFYFNQGELIGYTGSTGVGPPHLHFEIRDKSNRPINALLTDLEIEDTIPPKVSAILAIPMSDSTIIDGSKYPQLFYPSEKNDGTFDLGIISASGPIAIAINEYDQAENVTNRYTSYEFTLESKEGIHFYSKHDSFDFEDAGTMFIDRIPAHGAYRRSFQTLFQEGSASVPFYGSNINQGILIPNEDSTDYRIVVNDIYGNETEIQFKLILGDYTANVKNQNIENIFDWYWRNDWITQHQNKSVDLTSNSFGYNWDSSKNKRFADFDSQQMLITRFDPLKSKTIISTDYNLKIHFTDSSFFDSTSIAVFTADQDSFPSFSVMPYSTPIRKNYFVEYYLGKQIDANENYQVFHYDPFRVKYTHVPSFLIGNTLHLSPNVLGEFRIFPDNDAPDIDNVSLVTTNYGSNYIEIEVMDELSGIDFKRSEIQVNGMRGITEYDFEEEKLIYIHPDFKPESRNRIEVIVTDNAGNSRFEVYYR
jgi:hypothetical protein